MESRKSKGKTPLFLSQSKKMPLSMMVDEYQKRIENERKQLKMF